jgi:dTDP-4-amino-4,6-dideoxygalactose transaminase
MKIPFVDLKTQYRALKPQIDGAIQCVIEETAFVRGPYVAAFEAEYARRYGVKHCVSVGNGTDALYVALKSLGIGPGDEVITTAISWIATSEVITQTGARVVFVDIDPEYYTLDVANIERKITLRTKAIIPVHLYGQPAEMDTLVDLCKKHGLYLIEDCAQAHFAQFKGKRVGTFGDAGIFSFYPGKNLGAYGDAGAIITNDDDLAKKMRMFANHGALQKHHHEMEGVNSRMDGIQGAVLSVKLPFIKEWNERRYQNALKYNELLRPISGLVVPKIRPDVKHIFHVYAIRVGQRDALARYLKENGVATAVHYPVALPFMKAYEYLGCSAGEYPVAYKCQKEVLSLPMYPELSDDQIGYVAGVIKRFYVERRREKLQDRSYSRGVLPGGNQEIVHR